MMIDISIIIVNYKTSKLTEAAIKSLFDKVINVIFEIIVVDNNSCDGSVNYLENRFGNSIKVIALEKNIGFGRANNKGVEFAKGRVLFFLNPDTILVNNAVKILCNALDMHGNYGVVGGNLYDDKMLPTHSYRSIFPQTTLGLKILFAGGVIEKIMGLKNYQFNYTKNNMEVSYIIGADLMIKKDIFVELGGFNPLFFMYYEETELCYRVKKRGLKIMNIPDAKIIHLEGASFGSGVSITKFQRILNGRKIYYNILGGPILKFVADIFLLSTISFKYLKNLILNNKLNADLYKGQFLTLLRDALNK